MYSVSKDASIISCNWIKLGDLETQKKNIISLGQPKDATGHYQELLALSVNFDGKLMVTAGKDRMIKLWDLNSNKLSAYFNFSRHAEKSQGHRQLSEIREKRQYLHVGQQRQDPKAMGRRREGLPRLIVTINNNNKFNWI